MKKLANETMQEFNQRRREAGWFSQIGKKGGTIGARRAGSEGMSARGFKGGLKVLKTRGKEYYSKIGSMKKGEGRMMKEGR